MTDNSTTEKAEQDQKRKLPLLDMRYSQTLRKIQETNRFKPKTVWGIVMTLFHSLTINKPINIEIKTWGMYQLYSYKYPYFIPKNFLNELSTFESPTLNVLLKLLDENSTFRDIFIIAFWNIVVGSTSGHNGFSNKIILEDSQSAYYDHELIDGWYLFTQESRDKTFENIVKPIKLSDLQELTEG